MIDTLYVDQGIGLHIPFIIFFPIRHKHKIRPITKIGEYCIFHSIHHFALDFIRHRRALFLDLDRLGDDSLLFKVLDIIRIRPVRMLMFDFNFCKNSQPEQRKLQRIVKSLAFVTCQKEMQGVLRLNNPETRMRL
ncbi:MAG: hypothetical protein BWY44_00036 [Candidatus Omnitrophica bacterium ADurb.Bin292]|nr:MAG: hypothetical protein BWY44_00036 [Candidatus Omnitrophica bacterium ADurb.Bin292]